MQLTLLSEDDIRTALPMADAIEAMKDAFAAYSGGRAAVPLRPVVAVPPAEGMMLVKPAYVEGGGLGAKLVSVFPRNIQVGKPTINGLVVLLNPQTAPDHALPANWTASTTLGGTPGSTE